MHWRVLSMMAIFVGVLCAPRFLPAATPDKLQEVKEELERERKTLQSLRSKKTSVLDVLDQIDRRIQEADSSEARLTSEMQRLETRIAETENELRRKAEQLASERQLANERMVALYKLGELGPLKILFSSKSFSDLLRRRHDLRWVVHRDVETVRAYGESLRTLRSLREELVAQRSDLDSTQAKIVKNRRDLEGEKSHKARMAAAIASEEAIHKRYVAELEQAKRDLETLMERITKSKKPASPEQPAIAGAGFAGRKGKLHAPVKGKVVKAFGKFKDPKFYTYSFHKGIDISSRSKANVKAVYDGKVVYSGWFKGFGQIVILDHGGGYHTLSANAQDLHKAVGDAVREGEVIGRLPQNQKSSEPVLYFEVRQQGQSVDPLDWLARRELL